MKRSNLVEGLILVLLSLISLSSCSEDDQNEKKVTPFKMEKTYFEVPLKGYNLIYITNGSLEIDLSVDDEDIAEVVYSRIVEDTPDVRGCIQIKGKKKGTFQLLVTDQVTHESACLNIKITDPYLACCFNTTNHPLLTTSTTLFLINDEARTFYLFAYDDTNQALQQTPLCIGSYHFSIEKYGEDYFPYLTLSYISDENGMPTKDEQSPTQYKFSLLGSSISFYSSATYYLEVEWNNLKESLNTPSKRSSVVAPSLIMMEINRGYTASGLLTHDPIPDNILK